LHYILDFHALPRSQSGVLMNLIYINKLSLAVSFTLILLVSRVKAVFVLYIICVCVCVCVAKQPSLAPLAPLPKPS